MNDRNLIIYKFSVLYHILKEIDLFLNFQLTEVNQEKILNNKIKKLNNYLIVSNKKILNISEQIILEKFPTNIFKLIEKINIAFLKQQFSNQSQVNINRYIVNLNSREMSAKDKILKLTEKEIDIIIYLSKINKPGSIEELQENVWRYQPDIETHTVETHIYRLRKKILKTFNDNEFIVSKKNGYQVK